MFETEDQLIDRIAANLRRPVRIDPALDERVMRAIATPAANRRRDWMVDAWRWLARPRSVRVSPAFGLAAAALLALLVVRPWERPPTATTSPEAFQFRVVAPRAARVALVGDFNNWDPSRTPMAAAYQGGLWTATVALAPGRYRYAFLVDGAEFRADPAAPRAHDDEFGAPSSVVTVGGGDT